MPEYLLSPLVASWLMPILLVTRHKVRPWKLSVAMNTRTIRARFLTWQNSLCAQLLAQYMAEERHVYHISMPHRQELSVLEMDTDNAAVQDLISGRREYP